VHFGYFEILGMEPLAVADKAVFGQVKIFGKALCAQAGNGLGNRIVVWHGLKVLMRAQLLEGL
jgi:hypothetical protein